MQTTQEARREFREAFARYREAEAWLLVLRGRLTASDDSAAIHGIDAGYTAARKAETDYRAARLEYAGRLLAGCAGTGRAGRDAAGEMKGDHVTKVYVGNLLPEATAESVRSLFEVYGDVQRVRMNLQSEPVRPRLFAFVEMTDSDADEAIRALHGREQGNHTLRVIRARPARAVSRSSAG